MTRGGTGVKVAVMTGAKETLSTFATETEVKVAVGTGI